jgi:hypothetical protein
MKICQVGAEFFLVDGQTDGQTDGQADIHDETNCLFPQFCERA